MIISFKLEDFAFELFPEAKVHKENSDELLKYFSNYYSYGIYKPDVNIEDGIVFISIDDKKSESEDAEYRRVVSLCEKGKYFEAKRKLDNLLKSNPAISEYHRIYGQILSDEGKQEEAIDSLIDALRWDPKNTYALLMMGNIFGKFKNDFDTSMKYYEQALKSSPEDNIILNNIGATLMQLGKYEESKKFFLQAVKINNEYPNTHYALSIIAEKENDLQTSFEEAILSLKNNKEKTEIYKHSFDQAASIAR